MTASRIISISVLLLVATCCGKGLRYAKSPDGGSSIRYLYGDVALVRHGKQYDLILAEYRGEPEYVNLTGDVRKATLVRSVEGIVYDSQLDRIFGVCDRVDMTALVAYREYFIVDCHKPREVRFFDSEKSLLESVGLTNVTLMLPRELMK